MSVINTKIKPFTAQGYDATNNKFIEVSEKDILGSWVVFIFYPADFTFVCPTELEDVADHYAELTKMGVKVFSVSTDTHFAHKAWHDTSEAVGKVNYVMLGDPSLQISRNFEVLREDTGLANRGTFIADPDGTIQSVEITAEGIGRSAKDLIRKIKAAQFTRANPGQVCPAKWEKEGDNVLNPGADAINLTGKI